jgi:hypothetical protein
MLISAKHSYKNSVDELMCELTRNCFLFLQFTTVFIFVLFCLVALVSFIFIIYNFTEHCPFYCFHLRCGGFVFWLMFRMVCFVLNTFSVLFQFGDVLLN